ncbi:hypothetical protein XA68_14682 [Ophiocordyceps unilateralis]|uniref:Myosin motor domain-containing protein n=1 Tax=Ophiocordyceps unilateralis TaxID=268505 RepID=A0A2A9P8D7_OPHUN|nr:hypothetical protein XA68_14682 [Ophiocordyceps unilateralis]
MSSSANGSSQRRNNPFSRAVSPSVTPTPHTRPNSGLFSPPVSGPDASTPASHGRSQSSSSVGNAFGGVARHHRSESRSGTPTSGTFAPSFIKLEEDVRRRSQSTVDGIEGENDFSGRRYVWLKDPQQAFIRGWVIGELPDNRLQVQIDDGTQRQVDAESVDKVNPAKFDKANDMAELTHLNEASVVHNLHMRYQADLIYTYSGLFLVAVNPYCPLPIYNNEYVNMYKGRSREDTKPHIFAVADEAFRNLVEEGRNQSILVIHYLAAVAQSETANRRQSQHSSLSQQILRANPILESFGNAQTVRNNNSSRFGKFIRIEFSRNGVITGAFIDWYLLEKSRVILKGADQRIKSDLLLDGLGVEDFAYTRNGHDSIVGVSDKDEWDSLMEAFDIMGLSTEERLSIFRTVAAVLHLGNIDVVKESRGADQARLAPEGKEQAARSLLHPKVKAGREWVEKVQTPDQLDRSGMGIDDSYFIGVLDIAGFEIFEENSFEQLCINYTNEKLQQFFNHHMFVLEQEEYAREQIEWQFIDFGCDLQPTIDLIELSNPIGIFSCLDEDCVMPKATDASFTDKLNSLWDKKSTKYRPSRLGHGFMLTHYAAEVEYSTQGWLEKNKDPMNDNITRLLASSTDKHIAALFADCADTDEESNGGRSRVKKGLFRTLHSTHPHFLRCNGVLEGIRIARTGFPNRLPFSEFRQRYEAAAILMVEKLNLDKALYRVGLSKVFFRAGVLAELEEKRDALITEIMARFQSVARGFVQRRSAYKKLFRTEATHIIQKNFQVYLDLVENPWWQLIVKMKPLLGATRTATEVKRRDAMIKQLNDKMRLETETRQKLEDERRNCQSEMIRIQQTLESERALALDKEEIFKRLQNREAELEEKLAGAIEDQERLEDQLDDLMEAKNRAEREVEKIRSQLEQAAALITKLEEEKRQLSAKSTELEQAVEDISQKQSERSEQEAALEDQIKILQSQLAVRDKKTQDLEKKLVQTDQDSEVKLRAAQKEVEATKKRSAQLSQENDKIQQQLTQLSKTSTDWEDLVRSKESELALLRSDKRKFDNERRSLEDQKKALMEEKEKVSVSFRDVQAELAATKSKQSQLGREADEAKKLLEARLSEDAQADENRSLLESQIKDLKEELYKTQKDLSRERQSRDDVLLLGEHKYQSLKEEFDTLNESKIIIEKELYAQQDTLRRTIEARTLVEKERDEARDEIRRLRVAKTQAEEARLEAEVAGERQASKAAREREESLRKDLEAAQQRLQWFEDECGKLNRQIEDLNKLLLSSGEFGLKNDQAKERMERELGTVKSRLAASENDNRALLNKLQQKGLEIARSTSRAADASRTQLLSLQREKTRLEEQTSKLNKQLGDSQVTIASLEKKTEKLQLRLEDLNHEVAREVKSSRNAEKASSNSSVQLAEANRTIESERQLRTQAQTTVRTLQASLDSRDKELEELRAQILSALKTADPDIQIPPPSEKTLVDKFDLVRKVEALQQSLRAQTAARTNAESQLAELRASRADTPSRAELKELHLNEAPYSPSPTQRKAATRMDSRRSSNHSTPTRRVPDVDVQGSTRSDKTVDTASLRKRMDLKSEVEELQNQLQLAQMQNRHLQSQLDRGSPAPDGYDEQSPSVRRMQKLEKANSRLHDMLDDSAKKVSTLEKNIRTGELSLRDVQARSHEEILDVLNSQEESRRSLLHSHKDAVAELTDVKSHFDKMRHERAKLEVELRDAKSDLEEMTVAREQESQSRSQLLQEYTDVQIRLDAESSKLADVTSSLDMYKTRADEYFGKLEQAEMTVLKASRAEQFAKSQAKEAEDTYAEVMAERQKMEAAMEDLQRQNQRLEERVEDISTDLESITQAKKRLQHELEDYRNQRAIDIEDKESSMEQTRKKYQAEFATLTKELDLAREEKLYKQAEIARLREELDELRSKWDDEVLNSSTWAKEKARLESTLADVASSRDEAVNAHNEAQGKVVSLLSQVRTLRSSVDEMTSERDLLLREKRSVEGCLAEAKAGLEELSKGESPSVREAATMDKELLELRSNLAHQEDIAVAAVERMRRAEALVSDIQKDIALERESGSELLRQKASLEKNLNEAQLKLVDLETKGYSSASQDIKFLHKRIQELETQLESKESERSQSQRSARNIDRVVKDLQSQIERKEKQNNQLSEDGGEGEDSSA